MDARHVHFPSPLLVFSRRLSTPLSTPSTPLLLSPSPESPTFRPFHTDDIESNRARRSLSLDSFLVLTAIQPPHFSTKAPPTVKSNPRCLASRLLQAVLPVPANPLPPSRSYQDALEERLHQPRSAQERRGILAGSVSCFPSSQSKIGLSFASCSRPQKTDHCLAGATAAPSVLLSQKNRRGVDFPLLNGSWKRGLKNKLKLRAACAAAKASKSSATGRPTLFVPNKIPTSCSFPIASASGNICTMEEFNEDFVPYSYVEKGSTSNGSPTDESVQIRRMSLKEFSGLDHSELSTSSTDGSKTDLTASNTNSNAGSPLRTRLQNASLSANVGNLLDKFSNRRRSSAGLSKLSTWNSFTATGEAGGKSGLHGDNIYDSFNIAIEGINMAINEATKNSADGNKSNSLANTSPDEQKPQLIGNKIFEQVYKKLETVKERLTNTMKNVPNESPKKVDKGGQTEKLEVLNETRLLVGACKSMVRFNTQPINDKELFPLIETTVHCADKVTHAVEAALRKRTSLFQAELLTAKTEQMLKALTETVRDLERAYGTPKHGQEAKQLVRSSTTLAASLTQLIQAIQHI